ncbi:MAG: 4-phosphoerythronate dehydrogenase PdxB [Bacteroidales bacterium]|jgi:erythronate-4-phosphate dehydrogenase|nr:4-phosphoerythronate dehydrogenase PdxB [Bacteroidales bacterium]
MKMVCDSKIPFLQGVFEPFAQVLYLPGGETTPAAVRDADALLTRTRTRCDAALLSGSSVRIIASATIGYDHIDTAWCEANGILWTNAPGCNAGSVEQYVAAALCTLARRHAFPLAGRTLGVVGVGHVGSRVARMAAALGMDVLLCDPPRRRAEGGGPFISLDELVARSDIVTLHVPLTRTGEDATWHLIDAARLSAMRPDQYLLNSSRGPVVDGAALKAALQAKALGGAVLDVWEDEPEPDRALLDLVDIATPHIAGYSADGKAAGTAAAVRAVAAVLDLPLKQWQPAALPAPARPLSFTLDARGKTLTEVLSEAVLYTYDILADDAALRADPARFEELRGDYPIRREPGGFQLHLQGGTREMAEHLSALGFRLR